MYFFMLREGQTSIIQLLFFVDAEAIKYYNALRLSPSSTKLRVALKQKPDVMASQRQPLGSSVYLNISKTWDKLFS